MTELPDKENARLIFLIMMELIDDITELDQNIEYLIDEGYDINKIKSVFKDTKYLTFRDQK